MHIISIQSFTGRNIYSHRPVIKMVVDIENLYNTPTNELGAFNEKLVELFPGLGKHCCSEGYEGGFVRRLKEGTYLGHVLEHLILELQSISGYDISYGKTRILKEPSLYYIVYEYTSEKCAIECGKTAVVVINGILARQEVDVQGFIADLKKIAVEYELGPSTKAIYDEAKKRGIPVTRLGNESLLQLGYGKHSRLIEASLTDSTSCISADMASNKHLTKQILDDNDIPVPYGDIVYTEMSAVILAGEIGYPVVVKPYDGNQGKGVTLNIADEAQVRAAFNEAMKYSKAVIVEKFVKGKDYRVLVVGDRVVAVSERRPPTVTGDGIHTIRELVDTENRNVLRGEDHEKPLTVIKLDSVAKQLLERQGKNENYIPSKSETVVLRENGNLSTGGTARSCTSEIHPYNSYIAVKAAKAIGLDIAGIDFTAEDISRPINDGSGALIEVNAAPGLRMHIYPTEGEPVNVAAHILNMMFPKDKPFTIPIISVTGTNGKTTTTRLIRHTLAIMGYKVGMTSTSGIYIGDRCVMKGDNTGPSSARIVLADRDVDAAVLETARGGLVRKGLGYDLADIGVVVNISEDHIGLDGIESVEDLAFAKALVIEAVKREGVAVINADDRMAEYLMGRAKCNIMLFSREKNNPLLARHMEIGGNAVYIENNTVHIYRNNSAVPLMKIEDIPITIGGILECNIENSLAAIAALCSLKVPADILRLGLKTFKPDISSNPGRFNIFNLGDFKVMLDYGHNPAGYNAVLRFIRKTDAARFVGIIGIPGDRPDKSMREIGAMCSSVFSRVIVKEDRDLRGREPGETAGIIYNSLIANGFKKENAEIILSEEKALETAILDAQPGDLIVMFYEELEPAVELINLFKQELEQSTIGAEEIVGEVAG